MNDLHRACYQGNARLANALLCSGSFDVNEGTEADGSTPLMIAAFDGHSRIIRPLLDRGADLTLTGYGGLTPLHMSAQNGHLAATKMLIKAGSQLETLNDNDYTPLHVAAMDGFSKVMRALIDAGANVDTRLGCGVTPMFTAARRGHLDAVSELLLAKANPTLGASRTFFGGDPTGEDLVPLDVAATEGHVHVVRELVERVGIAGCGGRFGGVNALRIAVEHRHANIAAVLIDAGVTDMTGIALTTAAGVGPEASVKLLLQQHGKGKGKGGRSSNVDTPHADGATATLTAVEACRPCSTRIVRLLLDADADPTSAIRVRCRKGCAVSHETPWAVANRMVREKRVGGQPATAEQLRSLKATHRLLLQAEAVLASSWLWRSGSPAIARPADGAGDVKMAGTNRRSLGVILPILRRRNRRRSVLFTAMSRYSQKHCQE